MGYSSSYTEHYQQPGASGESYDRSLANRFELAIFQLEQVILQDLFRRYRSSDPDTAYLDYACGTGWIMGVFKDLIRNKLGVDTSTAQPAVAQRKAPDAEFIHGNVVAELGLPGGQRFSFITSFRLLLNLEPEHRSVILRALRELLTPDGYLVVDNHMNRYSVLGLTALFAHKVLRVPRKPLVPPGKRGIISTMSEFEVRRLLSEAGLEPVKVHRIFVFPGHGKLQLLPTRWLVPVEAFMSRIPLLKLLSKSQIYVCRRTQLQQT
jgi:ubiquinone/menaquinone biosynthesis C-methylase UbiE